MDVSFLTPFDALFALAAVVPVVAFVLAQRRAAAVRRLFSLPLRGRRELVLAAAPLVLLPALVGVAATQPVVVRPERTQVRADAQVFFVFDTSLSMSASAGPNAPTRLTRAKREAMRIARSLGEIPAGVAVMTDRMLPVLLPTTDLGLLANTVQQSVEVNSPPPSRTYSGRASTFTALTNIRPTRLFPEGVTHPLLVAFTDGESATVPPTSHEALEPYGGPLPVLAVHVWAADERIYVHGAPRPGYSPDPESTSALRDFAKVTGGQAFSENEIAKVAATIRKETRGRATTRTVSSYARVALAPWFVLAGVLPLGFLLWRRNT
ncbi:MAG TPA: vWA domain-containing protein [Gaiellaceae bacterium]|nr:vWA domain-containing protein [Gaiellaceae bacterium]